MPGDHEAFFTRAAAEVFEALSAYDQEQIDRIIRDLSQDPYIAPPLKVRFDVPPAVVTLYNDQKYWVVYHIQSDSIIQVWNVGVAEVSDPDPLPDRRPGRRSTLVNPPRLPRRRGRSS